MNRLFFLFAFILIHFVDIGDCIQCYKCESVNGNNPECELGLKKEIPYHNPCQVGTSRVKGNRCIKIVGTSAYDPSRMVVIRDCTDKPHNKEGFILFDKFVIRGRAHTCKHNLCNGAGILGQLDPVKFIAFICLNMFCVRTYFKALP